MRTLWTAEAWTMAMSVGVMGEACQRRARRAVALACVFGFGLPPTPYGQPHRLDKESPRRNHPVMELVAGSTIWGLFSCFLLFPLLGLPRRLAWAAMTLLVVELGALLVWSYGSRGCTERPCGAAAEAGRTAATIDVPLLSVALLVLAGMHVRRAMKQLS